MFIRHGKAFPGDLMFIYDGQAMRQKEVMRHIISCLLDAHLYIRCWCKSIRCETLYTESWSFGYYEAALAKLYLYWLVISARVVMPRDTCLSLRSVMGSMTRIYLGSLITFCAYAGNTLTVRSGIRDWSDSATRLEEYCPYGPIRLAILFYKES